jgi:predicted permease
MNAPAPRPPALGRLLLRLVRPRARRAEMASDLLELFEQRLETDGIRDARRRYTRDVLSVLVRRSARSAGRAARIFPDWAVSGMWQDIRFATRLFRRQAGVVTLAVLGLAVAMGVNTAAFTLANAVVFRGVGIPDPSSAVIILSADKSTRWPYAHYEELRQRSRLMKLEAEFLASVTLSNLDGSGSANAVTRFVSGTFLSTFGARPEAGRLLGPADDDFGVPPVAVLNHGYWTARFGADPSVVGRTVLVAGVPVRIVGVVDRHFTGPFPPGMAPALWLPLRPAHAIYYYFDMREPRGEVAITGRLTSPSARAAAEAEASAILASLLLPPNAPATVKPTVARVTFVEDGRTTQVVLSTIFLLSIVALVLLLACTNVANLLLASAGARQREIAARLALGAAPRRIVRQLLTESLLLSLMAAAVGLLFTLWVLPVALRLVPPAAVADISPDYRVFAFAVVTALAAGLLAGLSPARYGVSGDVVSLLKGLAPSGGSRKPARLRSTFIGLQAATSMVLVSLALLFGRVLIYTSTTDLGFDPARFVSVAPGLMRSDPKGVRAQQFTEHAVARAQSLPWVERAALTVHPPFSVGFAPQILTYEGRDLVVLEQRTSPEYFDTMGLPILRGRAYTTADEVRRGDIVVVSASLARKFWGARDPIGETLIRRLGNPAQVIGVAGDVIDQWKRPGLHTMYVPLQRGDSVARLLIRTRGDAASSLRPLQDAIGAIDPGLKLNWSLIVADRDEQLEFGRVMAAVTSVLGGLALLLAVVGIVGVTACVVHQRVVEIGIRVAIGATNADILGLLVRDAMRPVAIGLGVGLATAMLAGQFFASRLYGLSPRDPVALTAAIVVLAGAAMAAVLAPAHRAARVDPATVLRT